MVEIKVPVLPESVTDAQIAVVHKNVGDYCEEGEALIELETDKVMLEVPATVSGVITKLIVKREDEEQHGTGCPRRASSASTSSA